MKDELKRQLGLKIKSLRETEKLTQEELSVVCDVSWRTISNLERGVVMPDLRVIVALSKYFKISLDDVLNINESEKSKPNSRIEKENRLIEKIKRFDDKTLSFFDENIELVGRYFN